MAEFNNDNWIPIGYKIYEHLRSQVLLQCEWCFCRMVHCNYSLMAHVKGLIFVGWIRIRFHTPDNTYILYLLDEQQKETKRINHIKKQDLIITLRVNLDGDNVWERIKEMYLIKS